VPERWGATPDVPSDGLEEPTKSSLMRKLSWGVGIFLGCVIVGAGIFFIAFSGRSGGGPTISIDGPDALARGVPFDLTVSVSNQGDTMLRATTLNLTLPPGLVALGGTGARNGVVSEPIGDLGSGILTQKSFKLLPIGDIRSVQKVTASVSYGSTGSGRFDASESREVTITQSAITLEIQKLDKVLSGSVFTVDVKYKNVSGFDFPDVTISAKYPTTFAFKDASLTPDAGNNVWHLGGLKSGSEGTLSITGTVEGPDDARYGIPVTLDAGFGGEEYTLAEGTADIMLAPSPITLDVTVNGSTAYVAKIGDQLVYTVGYKNTSGIALADVVIRAALTGDLFDVSSLGSEGQFDSLHNSIVWNAASVPSLRLLDPGAGGTVSVAVKLKSAFPMLQTTNKNFTVAFAVTVDSPSVPFYLTASKTSASRTVTTKVGGFVTIDAQAFYRDPKANIANLGSLPPKANTATEYTVHWVIKNAATDVDNVQVSAFLQGGVLWTNQVKSNIGSAPSYNDRTQELTWTIPHIAATKGFANEPIEAVFQVQATPSITQVGRVMPLIGETRLSAVDLFTSSTIETGDSGVTTALPDDPTVGQGAGVVVP
jgi:hypothetical protein